MRIRALVAGRGALKVLSLFLAAACAIKLGQGIGAAMAFQAAAPSSMEGTSSSALNCPEPPAALAAALRERDATISIRESALQDRLAALNLSESVLSQRIAELELAEDGLRKALAIADGAAEKDLQRLTSIYEAMKPAEAAALFETMNPNFAAGFLGRMRPDAAASVLSGMTADQAYSISLLLAGRNATAPRE